MGGLLCVSGEQVRWGYRSVGSQQKPASAHWGRAPQLSRPASVHRPLALYRVCSHATPPLAHPLHQMGALFSGL